MAKIIGNTIVTPYPRPDWNQTDETKVDYIKNKPTDYVVEQGANGNWTYRKWASGVAECWGMVTYTPAETVSSGGDIEVTFDLPFTFSSTPIAFIHPSALAYKIKKIYQLESTVTSVVVCAKLEDNEELATTETVSFTVNIKGKCE